MGAAPRVIVVGSVNVDHVWSVTSLPAPGQTLLAKSVRQEFGGKGANQAVAAARQGASVALAAITGDDPEGERYRCHLAEAEQIDVSALLTQRSSPTGVAHVYVDDSGENMIVVHRGANQCLPSEPLVAAIRRLVPGADLILLQLEIPLEIVRQVLELAADAGIATMLNASPFEPALRWDIPVDTVVVNETECREFFGSEPSALIDLSATARRALFERHRVLNLVVTRGAKPTLHLSVDAIHTVPAHPVTPRDTVGAGDTFAGALAVRRAEGAAWPSALRHANTAAALSTLAAGAQTAMPDRATVDRLLRAGTPRIS